MSDVYNKSITYFEHSFSIIRQGRLTDKRENLASQIILCVWIRSNRRKEKSLTSCTEQKGKIKKIDYPLEVEDRWRESILHGKYLALSQQDKIFNILNYKIFIITPTYYLRKHKITSAAHFIPEIMEKWLLQCQFLHTQWGTYWAIEITFTIHGHIEAGLHPLDGHHTQAHGNQIEEG